MLGKRIKELRKANNLTQADLAERIGVSLGAVKHWEQGRGEPNAAALMKNTHKPSSSPENRMIRMRVGDFFIKRFLLLSCMIGYSLF